MITNQKLLQEALHWWLVGVRETRLNKKGVYVITNIATDQQYIGCTTTTFGQRWQQHQLGWEKSNIAAYRSLSNNLLINSFVQHQRNFYCFNFSILETMNGSTDSAILEKEKELIAKYHPFFNVER